MIEKMLCITNRKLVKEDFLLRIEKVAAMRPAGIVLRESDLDEAAYRALLLQVLAVCERAKVNVIVHKYWRLAYQMGLRQIYMPLKELEQVPEDARLDDWTQLYASCHSLSQARFAVELGATRVVAGHVFETDSHPTRRGRGLDFVHAVVGAINPVPVFAIGGITPENARMCLDAGAAGVCAMRWFMS